MLEESPGSKLNVVWVGENQNLFGDRVRLYLSNKRKQTMKLKTWLITNGSKDLQSSLPNFFMHKNPHPMMGKRSSINFYYNFEKL